MSQIPHARAPRVMSAEQPTLDTSTISFVEQNGLLLRVQRKQLPFPNRPVHDPLHLLPSHSTNTLTRRAGLFSLRPPPPSQHRPQSIPHPLRRVGAIASSCTTSNVAFDRTSALYNKASPTRPSIHSRCSSGNFPRAFSSWYLSSITPNRISPSSSRTHSPSVAFYPTHRPGGPSNTSSSFTTPTSREGHR